MRDCSHFSVLIFPLKSITVLSTPGGVNSPGWAALSYTSKELVMKTSPETGHTERRAVRPARHTRVPSSVTWVWGRQQHKQQAENRRTWAYTLAGNVSHRCLEQDGHRCIFHCLKSLFLMHYSGTCHKARRNLSSQLYVHMSYAGDILPYLTVKVFLLRKAYEIYLLL